jgi:hypothetical protein
MRPVIHCSGLLALATIGAALGAAVHADPADRQAYYGDLHLHTSYSFDAYVLFGAKVDPDAAYRFARGESVDFLGGTAKRNEPLDFLAVTDHSENIGVFNSLDDPNSEFSKSEVGKAFKANPVKTFFDSILSGTFASGKLLAGVNNAKELSQSAWQREIEAANRNYRPGTFTTFIAYEWSSMPDGQNLHRNVIFRGDKAPNPFSSVDSPKPEDLWNWLDKIRKDGYEALAIPHNSNASNGLMFDWNDSNGRPIDQAYAEQRASDEPLVEIAQNKGASETHPYPVAQRRVQQFRVLRSSVDFSEEEQTGRQLRARRVGARPRDLTAHRGRQSLQIRHHRGERFSQWPQHLQRRSLRRHLRRHRPDPAAAERHRFFQELWRGSQNRCGESL